MIRTLIADSERLFAEALGAALDRSDDLTVIDEYPADLQTLLDVVTLFAPSVAIVDLWMGVTPILPDLAGESHGCKVIVTAATFTRKDILDVLEGGVAGFLPKTVRLGKVEDAVRRAYSGETPVFGDEIRRLMEDTAGVAGERAEALEKLAALSPGEVEVLATLSSGETIQAVAARLNTTPRAIRSKVTSILAKTGYRSSKEAIAMAKLCGLIPD